MRLLRVIAVAIALCAPWRGATGSGLLPELDASSPAATLHSFLTEMERITSL